MKYVKFYTPENVERAKYLQMAVGAVAIAVCLFMLISAVLGVQRVKSDEMALQKAVSQSRTQSCAASTLRRQALRQAALSGGGVDTFALQLSRWAKETDVDVESLSPEGTPGVMDIKMGATELGQWNVHKVRLNGRGDFLHVMALLNKLRDPHLPVQLDSVLLQGVDAGLTGVVSFNVLCTVYEKKSEKS